MQLVFPQQQKHLYRFLLSNLESCFKAVDRPACFSKMIFLRKPKPPKTISKNENQTLTSRKIRSNNFIVDFFMVELIFFYIKTNSINLPTRKAVL